ncbi:MAG: hypothetical protein KOO69_07720 [Victivallales bacterium]|nr:hypothetical protein [Victivallales bacterium]
MQQNEKLKKELQALREENARLKTELSKSSLHSPKKDKVKARIHQEQLFLADKMKSLGILIGGLAHKNRGKQYE